MRVAVTDLSVGGWTADAVLTELIVRLLSLAGLCEDDIVVLFTSSPERWQESSRSVCAGTALLGEDALREIFHFRSSSERYASTTGFQ
jgi:hypothetical protein